MGSMLVINRSVCRDIEPSLSREWLVTNGLGGYASSTIVGANTSRYHGLLVASLEPPHGRRVLLSKIDEELRVADRSYYLGTNEYQGNVIHPTGFVHLEECHVDGTIPTFTFETGVATLAKTVWMEQGDNTTYVRYHLERASGPVTLILTLLCNHRTLHSLTRGALDWSFDTRAIPGHSGCEVIASPGAVPYRLLATPNANFAPTGVWYWHHLYRTDRDRGYQHTEDLYSPGLFRAVLNAGDTLTVIATTEPLKRVDQDAERALAREGRRQADLRGQYEDPFIAQLRMAADQFIVTPQSAELRSHKKSRKSLARSDGRAEKTPRDRAGIKNRHTIIAGYHWFSDWGRDTLISLPGLTLATGRFALAKEILRTYAHYASEGLMPNMFMEESDEPVYNAADVSLWYFLALYRYIEATGDRDFLAEVYSSLADVIDFYVKGTGCGIKVDPADGLLRAGLPGSQVTWMDAKVGDQPATPRIGKAVELNALWGNTLVFMKKWTRELGQPHAHFVELCDEFKASFAKRFWYKSGAYLYDVVDSPDGDDPSLRPNQLFAISLPHMLLSTTKAKAVLAAVSGHLLTPFGLRSLAPSNPAYRGYYAGEENQRNRAYHQGTVWAWLIGPYADALLNIQGKQEEVWSLLEPFKTHLTREGLGTVGEIFDGDPPHFGRGSIAQAWSVAELLRIWRRLDAPR